MGRQPDQKMLLKRLHLPTLRVTLALACMAILVLAVSFGLSLRAAQKERESYSQLLRASHWHSVQLQKHTLELENALARVALGDPSVTPGHVMLAYDLLWSRFEVTMVGREGRYLRSAPGVAPVLEDLFGQLKAIEPSMAAGHAGDVEGYRAALAVVSGFGKPLTELIREMALNGVTGELWDFIDSSSTRTVLYVAGIVASSLLLVGLLLVEAMRATANARQARQAQMAAEIANRAKSEFLANMSHELRTPLNAIIGFSEIIADGLAGEITPDLCREYARDIHNSGHHLLGIINDVLDISKVDAGQLELDEATHDLGAIVHPCLKLIQSRADDRHIAIETTIEGADRQVVVDGLRIRQALLNLLSNAVKFSPEGTLVRVHAQIDDGGGVTVSVEDSGPGMTREQVAVALERFRQIRGGYTKPHDGSGLGLPITKALVELHGGSLQIDSAPNRGTRASIHLPPSRLCAPTRVPAAQMLQPAV